MQCMVLPRPFCLSICLSVNHIPYSRIWHDPVIFPVIGPSVLSAANRNARVMTQQANSRPSDCIAVHYKIVPNKITDKLALKMIYDNFILLAVWTSYLTRCWRSSLNMKFIQLAKKNRYTPFLSQIIILRKKKRFEY